MTTKKLARESKKETATQQTFSYSPATPKSISSISRSTEKNKTVSGKIIVKYDCGFGNAIYIRGNGSNLSWEKGQILKNTKPDEWTWELDISSPIGEFKVLLNDTEYEVGTNHILEQGSTIQFTPQFPSRSL